MAHHIAQPSYIISWLHTWAPWMQRAEVAEMIDLVMAQPERWKADKLARMFNLTMADRDRLKIKTIGAVDMTKAERAEAAKRRKQEARRERRHRKGMQTRTEFLATHRVEATRPWEAEGISRATWYRRRPKARETGLAPVFCPPTGAKPVSPK